MIKLAVSVSCTRVEPTQVDCRQSESWLGLIRLGDERTIVDVEEADTDRRRSSNPSPHGLSSYTIHVRLKTQEGVVTAIECFSLAQAQEIAKRINAFIAGGGGNSLQVDNFNWTSASLGLILTVLPSAILGALALYVHSKRVTAR